MFWFALLLFGLVSCGDIPTSSYGGVIFPHIKTFTSGSNTSYPSWYQTHIDITHGNRRLSPTTITYVSWSDINIDNGYGSDFLQYFFSKGLDFNSGFLHYPKDTLIPTIDRALTVAGQTRNVACLEDRFQKVFSQILQFKK